MGKTKFDPEQSVIILNIALKGHTGIIRRIRMVLDTGATYTMIPWEIAEALGYEPEHSKEKVTLVTASGIETAPIIKVKEVNVLGEYISDVPVVCHDLPARSYVVGLLGASVLRHFKIVIDYEEGDLEFMRVNKKRRS